MVLAQWLSECCLGWFLFKASASTARTPVTSQAVQVRVHHAMVTRPRRCWPPGVPSPSRSPMAVLARLMPMVTMCMDLPFHKNE